MPLAHFFYTIWTFDGDIPDFSLTQTPQNSQTFTRAALVLSIWCVISSMLLSSGKLKLMVIEHARSPEEY